MQQNHGAARSDGFCDVLNCLALSSPTKSPQICCAFIAQLKR